MSITKAQLKSKISSKKQELSDLEAALRVAESYGDIETETPARSKIANTGVINLNDLSVTAKPAKKRVTMADDVKEVIERFGTQEFELKHVVAALIQTDKGKDSKPYKTRVSGILKILSRDGTSIERINPEAKGNTAFIYKNQGYSRIGSD